MKEFLIDWLIYTVAFSIALYIAITVFGALLLIFVIKPDDVDYTYFKDMGVELTVHDFYHYLLFEDSGADKQTKAMAVFLFPSLAIYITYVRIRLALRR